MKEQQDVTNFMVMAGQDTPEQPIIPKPDIRILRAKLIAEELCELCAAIGVDLTIDSKGVSVVCNQQPCNIVEAYDAILDIQVVNIGAAVAFGLDLDPGWAEVHRSNMSKFIDGYRREDGKWMKGPSYSPANLKPIIDKQRKD